MNESLFTSGAFDQAHPLTRPDFEVMMALAGLRQANSPTVRALARGGEGFASDAECILALLVGDRPDGPACGPIASFYDLSSLAADDGWPLARSERSVNLGISTYVQPLGVDASQRPQFYGSFDTQ